VDSRGGTDSANSPDNDGDSSEDSTRDNDGSEDGDNPPRRGDGGNYLRSGYCEAAISVQIPNYEIRRLFRQWLLDNFKDSLKSSIERRDDCLHIFQSMVSGSMASFAERFSKFMWQHMPAPFLGGKEYMYQAYMCSFFTVASQVASPNLGLWDVKVEECAGIGRLHLIVSSKDEAVIQEHKCVWLSPKDKETGYGDSPRERLTKAAERGLAQIGIKGYRARLPGQVTRLREFGIAFLGPYCAIAGCSLERERGKQWKIKETYDAEENEKQRDQLYTAST